MSYRKLKSVRLDEEIVNLVKDHKDKTRVPIGAFFELAAKEKLERESLTATTSHNHVTNTTEPQNKSI